jgi:hypothetical protein
MQTLGKFLSRARIFTLLLACSICTVFAQAPPWPHRQELLHLAHTTLVRYFGKATADYSDPGTVVDQIGDILGGAPDPEIVLPDGKLFFSACRAHSCPEKAAEVVDLHDKRVYALGLIHFRYRPDGPKTAEGQRHTMDREPTLTIFVFRTRGQTADDVAITAAVEQIKAWGHSVAKVYGEDKQALKAIEIVDKFEIEPATSEK